MILSDEKYHKMISLIDQLDELYAQRAPLLEQQAQLLQDMQGILDRAEAIYGPKADDIK